MVTNPLVSVIVRTKDRTAFLKEALDSIAAQTYAALEVVLVNDGGASVEHLLAPLQQRMKVVSVVHAEPHGRAQALNAGLHAATGDLVGYLDDDDRFYPDHVETLVAALRANPAHAVAYANALAASQHPDARSPTGYRTVARKLVYSWDFELPEFMVDNHIPNLCVIHDRALGLEVGGYDERLTVLEDWDFFIRLALARGPFLHVPATTGEYSVRSDQTNTIGLMTDHYTDRRRYVWAKYAETEIEVKVDFLQRERARVLMLTERLAGRENELLWWEDRWNTFEKRAFMRAYRALQKLAVRFGLITERAPDHASLQRKYGKDD